MYFINYRYLRANTVRYSTNSDCNNVCALNHYCAITRVDSNDLRTCLINSVSAVSSKQPAASTETITLLYPLLFITLSSQLVALCCVLTDIIHSIKYSSILIKTTIKILFNVILLKFAIVFKQRKILLYKAIEIVLRHNTIMRFINYLNNNLNLKNIKCRKIKFIAESKTLIVSYNTNKYYEKKNLDSVNKNANLINRNSQTKIILNLKI